MPRNRTHRRPHRIRRAIARRLLRTTPPPAPQPPAPTPAASPSAGREAPATIEQIEALLVRLRAEQSQDVWSRFKLYQLDGNLIPPLAALNEMYTRLQRVEAKLDRLLGQQPTAPKPGEQRAARRRYRLPMPPVPDGWPFERRSGDELDVVADWAMYVPRVLATKGVGGYEPSSVPHFLAALATAPSGAFLDIGLNVGPYALLARAYSDREVVGFEPTPDLASVARRIADDNSLGYDVEQLALGSETGTAQLYLSDSSDSSNSLNPAFRSSTWTLEVPLDRLDSWVARTGVRPGLIKIDTETTEPEVLAGALETVQELRPWIFCEVLHGTTEQRLTTVLADWGYTWYHLDGEGPLEPRTEIVGDEGMQHYMWLFTPAPVPQEHWTWAAAWRDVLDATPAGREVALG